MTTSITKIFIANRGEIACRVIRTAKERGIKTVAVYSDADKFALHVNKPTKRCTLVAAPPRDSYLSNGLPLVDAVKANRRAKRCIQALDFCQRMPHFVNARLEKEGIIFIGPRHVRAIEAMGDKIESKKLAQQSEGVSTVPGHPDAVPDADAAYAIAEQIGCPVMLKASAGGGGKGMRVANTMDEVKEGFISAQNEARTSFGDDRVFVEKFIEQPRHIEIQVIADRAWSSACIWVNANARYNDATRKCLKRRPPRFISDDSTRKAMGEQAVLSLSKAVDYQICWYGGVHCRCKRAILLSWK